MPVIRRLLPSPRVTVCAGNNVFRVAKQAVMRAGQYAYRDRRDKKHVFRRLWIARINAATRANGMTYSRFMTASRRPISLWTARFCPIWRFLTRPVLPLLVEQAKAALA